MWQIVQKSWTKVNQDMCNYEVSLHVEIFLSDQVNMYRVYAYIWTKYMGTNECEKPSFFPKYEMLNFSCKPIFTTFLS